jgi:glyoxylase-like metal-dependent hydrolase (beta-lactamase superfamily II)/rhodanese-related sulfurtransferase
MILKQYYLGCLAHASYLVADERSKTAAVIDPQRDIDAYLADAAANGVTIRHVFLTHFHADFLAGHLELRNRAGAQIYLGSRAKAEYAFTPLADGAVLEFGDVRLQVLETPGHSPESISLIVYDLKRDKHKPQAVLTGDTLFIGDVGRPDLRAALGYSAAKLADLLYDSLHLRLLALPDETLVYPAHGAGSLCGKNLSPETVSTIGVQRQYNYALQPMSKTEFLQMVTAEQPEAPPYFTYDAILNTKEHPTLEQTLDQVLKPLPLTELLARMASGAQVLDVRDPTEFSAGHLAGSINIGLNGQFASWAGTVLDREQPILLVASPGLEKQATTRLGRIGFDHVGGYLDQGMVALESHPEHVARTPRIAATTLAEQMASTAPPQLLDIRADKERRDKFIEGSLHIPLNHLQERMGELPSDRPLVVHCAGGYRSSIAASMIKRHGNANVSELLGGIAAWEKSGLPVAGQTNQRSNTVKPTNFSERVLEVAGWKLRLTSYELGGKYFCKADNVEPGACIARADGATKEECEQKALEKAQEYLSRTRRFAVS